jgi:transposase
MLQLVPQLRILLAVEPVDFRKGIDSLAALCRHHWQQDPFSGTLYTCPSDCTHLAVADFCYKVIAFSSCGL